MTPTPGIKTSEFWVNAVAMLLAILTSLGIHVAHQDTILSIVASLSTAAIAVVYTWQRTSLKQTTATILPSVSGTANIISAVHTAENATAPLPEIPIVDTGSKV
jgi:hypothetical protein